MLTNLHVKNLALIEEADIYFNNGLNILTGETGAGKSIILGSINIAIGNKVSSDVIRKGADYALTELMFHIEDEKVVAALKAMDIEELDDGDVLISRKIMPSRSVIKINGQNCTASQARQVASWLIDIHGQHDNQILLNESKHLSIVDEYAADKINKIKERLKNAYSVYSEQLRELKSVDIDAETRSRELSFMEYEVNEIESACLKENEDEELEIQFRKMSHMQKIMENISVADNCILGENGDCAASLLGSAVKAVSQIMSYDEKLAELMSLLSDIESMTNDAGRMIADYISDCNFNEEEYNNIQNRLDLINSLKMKYGKTIPDIINYCEDKKSRINQLNDHDNLVEKLKLQLRKQEEIVGNICEELTDARVQTAKKLEKSIVEALKDLNFLDVKFQTEFKKLETYTANGNDAMRFLISTNPGEDLKPLSKIASGGELSRIMLAIKTVTANQDNIGTLIFDEIDAGISGKTAQLVANKLSILSKYHQIICITHLPQIASMSDSHFMIEKTSTHNSTTTDIYQLQGDDSVKELARLLGGSEVTTAAIENANEMIKTAVKFKHNR